MPRPIPPIPAPILSAPQPIPSGQQGQLRHLRGSRPWQRLLPCGLMLLIGLSPVSAQAEGQVQLSCPGTLLETRGQAEVQRQTSRLQVSLGLSAEASTADQALDLLQRRLAAVRAALQALQVSELGVSSPSSWRRPEERGRQAVVEASLRVSGILAPKQLQGLIRTVGSLPGVQLAPVSTQADPAEDGRVRQQLLQQAWEDALRQARPLAELIGRPRLVPLEVRIDGPDLPVPMMTMRAATEAVPPFNPDELDRPRHRLTLAVRFCAR